MSEPDVFIHPSAYVDEPADIGPGTKIWHFCHVMSGARIGASCSLGQNVFVAEGVIVGSNVKIQNNVSLYTGLELEDDVFCGPSCVFTNVTNPRSQVPRRHLYERTLVQRGAYGIVRHPIYSGLITGAFGWALLNTSVVTLIYASVLLVFFDIKSRREERWLARKFPEYAAYQRRVRKLIPFVY